ncbi:hypothetical protein BK659_20335 [Pseudomonas brassicacearum]|uniref:CoF synthetase n=1 Tax=Pseudomonas brassicacearum TaxID=930166 RepID=A0A423H325_9PSED|nr:hypothetical protein [Pseudomonas brassicacearum]RON06640.1 hypothetical protein BK659_20335 [Pseudomonas brassicacearum]
MFFSYFKVPLYSPWDAEIKSYFHRDRNHCIPLLSKSHIISGFPNNFMTPALEHAIKVRAVEYANTSGSSNQVLQLVRYKNWWSGEFERSYSYCADMEGYSITKDRKALLTTAVCSVTSCYLDNPVYEQRIQGSILNLNTHPDPTRWTTDDIQRIDTEIAQFRPGLLEVDPTYLMIFLAKRVVFGLGAPTYRPRYITSSYEFLTVGARRMLEAAYQLPVFSMFGATEFGVLFLQDSKGSYKRCGYETVLELHPFIPERNIYELIVTSWKNELMPLLRYRTGDLIEVSAHTDPAKIFLPSDDVEVLKLHGRLSDSFSIAQGEVKTVADLDDMVGRLGGFIQQYQLIITLDVVSFKYVPGPLSSAGEEVVSIERELRSWFGVEYRIETVAVSFIPPESSGKFRLVKSELPSVAQ